MKEIVFLLVFLSLFSNAFAFEGAIGLQADEITSPSQEPVVTVTPGTTTIHFIPIYTDDLSQEFVLDVGRDKSYLLLKDYNIFSNVFPLLIPATGASNVKSFFVEQKSTECTFILRNAKKDFISLLPVGGTTVEVVEPIYLLVNVEKFNQKCVLNMTIDSVKFDITVLASVVKDIEDAAKTVSVETENCKLWIPEKYCRETFNRPGDFCFSDWLAKGADAADLLNCRLDVARDQILGKTEAEIINLRNDLNTAQFYADISTKQKLLEIENEQKKFDAYVAQQKKDEDAFWVNSGLVLLVVVVVLFG